MHVSPRLLLLTFLVASLAGCATQERRLSYGQYPSQAMGVAMPYAVWAPNDFRPDERLPMVVFLHGGGDDAGSFDRHRIGQALDEALAAGQIPRAVIVLPEGHLGFWANWRDGSRRYEDWVLDEVVPHVVERYHTLACPEDCHVMGVSMGGSGALAIALHHGGRFASAGILSAPVFDTEQMLELSGDRWVNLIVPTHRIWGEPARFEVERDDPFVAWQGAGDVPLRLFIAWAEHDAPLIRRGGLRLHEHLEAQGIEHHHEVFEGRHGWRAWKPVIARSLAYQLGHTATSPGSVP